MKKVKTKAVCCYNGHNVKPNKNVDLTFKFRYDELTNVLQLYQYLNEDVTILVKIGDDKPRSLGIFRVKNIKSDHDGESVVSFNSMTDFVNVDDINMLIGTELINIMFSAEIEEAEEDEENGE